MPSRDVYQFEDEPEDEWSPGDDVPLLLDNLTRRLALLDVTVERHRHLQGWLREIERELRHWFQQHARHATERDRQRAADIDRHIVVVWERLDHAARNTEDD